MKVRLAASLILVCALFGVSCAAVAWPAERRGDRLRVAGIACGLRVASAAVVSVALAATSRASVFPDEEVFLAEARDVMNGAPFTPHGYSNVIGVLYELTGPSAWLPRGLNVLAGTLLAVAVHELAHQLAGPRPALLAGLAVAAWPSLVLWSAVPLKDSFTLLLIGGSLLGAVTASRGLWQGAALSLVSMIGLEYMRPYAFVVASIAIAAGAAMVAVRRGRPAALAVATAAIVGLAGLATGHGFLGMGFVASHADTEAVDFARTEGAGGATGFAEPEPETLGDVLRGVPRGLLWSALGPFPWESGQVEARLLLVIELPIWYAVVAIALAGVRRLRDERWVTPLVFALGIVAVLAVYEGNAGTGMRQRAMVIPVVVTMALARLQPLEKRAGTAASRVDSVEDGHARREDRVERPRASDEDRDQVGRGDRVL